MVRQNFFPCFKVRKLKSLGNTGLNEQVKQVYVVCLDDLQCKLGVLQCKLLNVITLAQSQTD